MAGLRPRPVCGATNATTSHVSLVSENGSNLTPNNHDEAMCDVGRQPEKQTPPRSGRGSPIVGQKGRTLYSESHVTAKLVPSDDRPDGTASSAPVLPFTIMASFTALPKLLMSPELEESVA